MATRSGNDGGHSAGDPEERAGEFRPGDVIPGSGCQVIRVLGRGAHATAYEVSNDIGKALVVKVMHAHFAQRPGMAERFLKEARSLARLEHPNIVEVYRAGVTTGPSPQAYIEMQLLSGKDGRELIADGPLDVASAVDVLAEVSSALRAAHAAGIVHQDLKLDNLFAHDDKRAQRIVTKLLDFGIARVIGEAAAKGVFEGTIEYAAPEQLSFESPVTFKADLYALGVIAFELLTGRRPYHEAEEYDSKQDELAAALGAGREDPFDLELIRVKLSSPAPRVSEFVSVPPALDAVVASLLSLDPSERPDSAGEAESALRRISKGLATRLPVGTSDSLLLSRVAAPSRPGETFVPRVRAIPQRTTSGEATAAPLPDGPRRASVPPPTVVTATVASAPAGSAPPPAGVWPPAGRPARVEDTLLGFEGTGKAYGALARALSPKTPPPPGGSASRRADHTQVMPTDGPSPLLAPVQAAGTPLPRPASANDTAVMVPERYGSNADTLHQDPNFTMPLPVGVGVRGGSPAGVAHSGTVPLPEHRWRPSEPPAGFAPWPSPPSGGIGPIRPTPNVSAGESDLGPPNVMSLEPHRPGPERRWRVSVVIAGVIGGMVLVAAGFGLAFRSRGALGPTSTAASAATPQPPPSPLPLQPTVVRVAPAAAP